MKPLIALVVTVLLAGCTYGGRSADTHTISRTETDKPIEGRPALGMPIPIPGRTTVLVPFAIESEKGLFERDDPYARGGVSGGHPRALRVAPSGTWGGDVRWHNAIFRDLKSGDEWAVLNERGVIGQWQLLAVSSPDGREVSSRGVVFIAVIDDTNKDGLLDDLDARVAIITRADGRDPRRVTPPDTQVWDVEYDSASDLVFLRVASDTDRDGRFTYRDVAVPYVVGPAWESGAEAVVSPQTLEHAHGLLGAQPKR